MRKVLVVTALLLFAGIAFGQTSSTAPVDIEAEEAALKALMDNLDIESSLTEDALICGTDPSEFWNKQQFLELFEDISNDAPEINPFGDQIIKVAPDGNSAVVVTQYIISWSPKIPWRQVYHFVKTDGNWMIQFMNIAFIPKNEDIEKINEVIE